MIAKLTGVIDTLDETSLIIEVGGVGYLVSCSSRTLNSMRAKGEQVTLFIETVMRAESLHLYGFATREEQACFRLLTTVQGVGMRMALSLLSTLSPVEVYQAIAAQDKAMLTRAEGVGPKLASRMLTELKDKIPKELSFSAALAPLPFSLSPTIEDAISALVNLGYRRLEVVTAISKTQQQYGTDVPLHELIRQGLSLLARSST